MSDTGPGQEIIWRRVWMMGIGALAGLAIWILAEVLPDRIPNERLLLFVSTGVGGFFAALLAVLGPLPPGRAVLAAALAALPAAGLLTLASLRYAEVTDFLETGHAPAAFCLILILSLPYLIAGLREGARWNSYADLFAESWDLVARSAAALVFAAVFWGVVFLSDALLGMVGIEAIGKLLKIDPVPFVLTGAMAGLALAVMAEIADHLSPLLILRMLRLLLPVVLAVTAVFLLALPLRGLSDLFAGLSAAGVLLAMAVGIATLIAAAIEADDANAASSSVLLFSARALALALPLLGGLAVYAIWLRVAQYGWSPDRLAAGLAGAVALGYGLLYALAVLRRGGWMARIRRANTIMALAVIGVAALWLSPLLYPERLSARDQIARFADGRIGVEALDLWFIGRETGVFGATALAELAALDHPEAEALTARIAALDTLRSRYEFDRAAGQEEAAADRDALIAAVPMWPQGAAQLTADDLAGVTPDQIRRWRQACDSVGARPCVALRADLVPATAGDEVLFFWRDRHGVRVLALMDGAVRAPVVMLGPGGTLPADTIDRILDGAATLGPPDLQALDLGVAEILLLP